MKAILLALLSTWVLQCASVTTVNGQNPNDKYIDIEKLVASQNASDALAALRVLKNDFATDSSSSNTYWLYYAKASGNVSRYEDAMYGFNKAIQIEPNNSKSYYEKALFLTNNNLFIDSAKIALETAIKLEPKGEYYYWKGIVHQKLVEKSAAISDYETAIKLGFNKPELHTNLGIIYVEEQKLEDAIVQLNAAIALDTSYFSAYSARAKTNVMLNNIAAACKDQAFLQTKSRQIVNFVPDSVCTGDAIIQTRFAAEVCALTMQYSAAIKHYTQLIANKNANADDYLNRGFSYFQIKDYKKAETDYLKALTLPNAATDQIYDNLSLLYFDQNKMQQAIDYSTKRVALDPQNPVPYLDRGLAKRKLKKYDEAEKDFNKCLEIDSNFFRAYGYRAYLNLEKGDINKAFMDATKAIEINKEYGYAYLVLGELKVQLNIGDYCDDFRNAAKYGESAGINAIELYCK